MFSKIFNKIVVYGVNDQSSEVFGPRLFKEISFMCVNGPNTDEQFVCDFLIATFFDDEFFADLDKKSPAAAARDEAIEQVEENNEPWAELWRESIMHVAKRI